MAERLVLDACPVHPEGGYGFARHTAYERMEPPGVIIARWYCPKAHTTFGLLPDFLASRLSSTLLEVEAVARAVEASSSSLEAAAEKLRPDVGRQAAVRWVRRRMNAVVVGLPTVAAASRPSPRGRAATQASPGRCRRR